MRLGFEQQSRQNLNVEVRGLRNAIVLQIQKDVPQTDVNVSDSNLNAIVVAMEVCVVTINCVELHWIILIRFSLIIKFSSMQMDE